MSEEKQEDPSIFNVIQKSNNSKMEQARAFIKYLNEHKDNFTAKALLEEAFKHDIRIRIVKMDGESQIVTADYVPWRIDIEVKGKKIIKVRSLG